MKKLLPLIVFFTSHIIYAQKATIKDSLFVIHSGIDINGYIGDKINLCIQNRVAKQDYDYLVQPFKTRKETQYWQTEFWGKWILSAISAYEYKPEPSLKKTIDTAVKDLLATQTPDGYIGNYADTARLKNWDIWGRKYTMLGLLAYYDLTKDKHILTATSKLADNLLSEVGPGKVNIVKTGWFFGMPSSSVLEPIVLLYNRTREKRYLDFAKYIVQQWETKDGPQLISKAIQGIPVADRFPHPKNWWSYENGMKAYEMMSCYDGLLELYKITGNPEYLKAVEMTAKNIIDTEINIAGSGASYECWYHGKKRQTQPAYNMMETCVTQTWMKLCFKLLQQTGDPLFADQIEKSAYNALLASMVPDGSAFAKYTPLEGYKSLGEGQCGMNINCCIANGPRGFTMIPKFSYMANTSGISVNLYAESKARLIVGKTKVLIEQHTNYPKKDSIILLVSPDKPELFTLSLRIPAWSKRSEIYINGKKAEKLNEGSYCKIRQVWKKGDKVVVKLDLRGRIIENGNYKAIQRGPIVLARDSRINKDFIDEAAEPEVKDGYISLVETAEPNCWMSFGAPFTLGTHLENNPGPVLIFFSDFASAGSNWDRSTRFRVWIPTPLNVMYSPFKE